MKFTDRQIEDILNQLEAIYPEADCALHYGSVFQLLVAVVLSAQTTDKSVNVVTEELFQKYPDVESLSRVSEEELAQMIRRIGMYKTKSKNVLALCKELVSQYEGEVPGDYEQLIKLPGVGRKTANVVLSVGFGQQRIAVDTHVFRVSNRIGLVEEKDVLKTELALMNVIPEHRWSRTHHSLIFHGRNCCHARKPKCEECGIEKWCMKRL
ncbi:endonuclease III [Clostridium aminobutyricum]|uniref:Endonuclease III n=1 Tax=Clostridium aminobutyricum TaxID=33953 RepID=A0A939D774_CLOAM|nr:endonuclease III [Clostridium aminobutyricum]MBN7772008.1 endonuclease III [Clostridium aminobutyricum]